MSDKTPLNVYDPPGDDYDFEDVEEVDTQGPLLGGFAGAGLAVLSLLILVGLCSTLVHRDKSSITISHLSMVCIGVLIAAAGVVFLLMWKKHVEQGGKLNWLVYGIIFVLVALMACYCLASAVYMYMYRPFHFGKLSTYNSEEWKDRFIDTWDFQRGWKEDRRIIWWISFFTVLAGLGFLILAVSMWVAAANKVPLAKMLLAVACFAGILLALFALHYLWRTHQSYNNNLGSSFDKSYLWMFGILLVIAIVIFLANLVVNVLKKKGLYFLFGFILLFFLVVFVVFLGLILRSMRQAQFSDIGSTGNCPTTLGSIHRDSVATFCSSGKYLPAGKTCYKNFMVREWENSSKPVRFLNPGCCKAMINFNLWPFYILGCFGLLILSAIMAAIVANFYLGDTRDYLSDFDKSLGIIELAMLGLAVLALIAFAFWFGFMPAGNTINRNQYAVAANSNGTYDDANFTPVNLGKVYGGSVPDSASLSSAPTRAADTKEEPVSLKTQTPLMKLTPKTTCDENCRVRVALLAVNGKIARPTGTSFAPSTTKKAFFNNAPADSDYAMVYGTEAEVSSFLNGLTVSSEDMTKHTEVYMKTQEVSDGSTWTDGLTTAEADAGFKNNFVASQYPISNVNDDCHLTNSCKSTLACDFNATTSCQKGYRFYNHGDNNVKVTIPYRVTDHEGNTIPFKGYATVDGAFDQWNNNTSVKANGGTGPNLNQVNITDGNATFDVPQPYRQDFDLVVNFMDNNSHYIREETVVTIPAKSAKTVTTDTVNLLTSNGKYCAGSPTEAACWAAKTVETGNVVVTVRDESNNALVEGARVELFEDQTLANSAMMTASTDSQGKAVFPNMGYDRYYVKYNGSTKFLPTSEKVELQGAQALNNGELTLMLHPRADSTAILSEYMNPGENRDLAVNVKNYNNGNTCTVDATSKYCAYMSLEDDVDGAQAGYERVKINKFTESYYLAYKKPTPAFSSTCSYQSHGGPKSYYEDGETTTIRSLGEKFDWSNVRKTSNLNFESLYCFNGWGLNSKKVVRTIGTAEPTAAALCPGLYPSGTEFALDRLHSLNNQ